MCCAILRPHASPRVRDQGDEMKGGVTPSARSIWRRCDWREAKLVLLAAPALVVLCVVLFVPLVNLLSLSVASGSFAPYRHALSDALYLKVIGATFSIAFATTAICLILGYPVAYLLSTSGRMLKAIGFVGVLLPFWTSLLVRTYAWIALLGRNGVINGLLLEWGVISEPLPLLYNIGGVLVGTVHVLLPYMVFPIYAAMMRIDRDVLLAAEGLGAGSASIFWRVYLPLTLPGLFAGCALVFILSLSAFVTPALLGGGRVIMIANIIQTEVSQFLNWPFATALSAIVLVVAILVYIMLGQFTRTPDRSDVRLRQG
jgi:ABC-type spermidine/putrescine transport system permease subunit I